MNDNIENGGAEILPEPTKPESVEAVAQTPGNLTLRQELFCQLYTKSEAHFANATLSYAEAYGYNIKDPVIVNEDTKETQGKRNYDICSALGSRLLSNSKIYDRVTELFNEHLTDKYVDAELAKVIKQNWKLEPKVAAIREYNKLKQRIIDKSENTVILPAPLLANLDVSNNNSNQENSQDVQEDTGSPRGYISGQDSIDRSSVDGLSTEGQNPDFNVSGVGILASLEEGGDTGLLESHGDAAVLPRESVE